jgi:rSAM/selenodomain-associated transferase 2
MLTSIPEISIIIPALNEEDHIVPLLQYLKKSCNNTIQKEIIVVDGGSTDCTVDRSLACGVKVLRSEKSRAKQMNLGAKHARGSHLYFLHADTLPPENFDKAILQAVQQDYKAGCFRMKFDHGGLFLRFFSWFSRINHNICRGGDQSLFITRELFEGTGGFDEAYFVYEDCEFTGRLYDITHFKILPQYVKTSARKYEVNGMLQLQFHFGVIHLKKYMGAPPESLHRYYRKNIVA